MKVGDLVTFRNCHQQGLFGIIAIVPKHDSLYPPGCWLYWVHSEIGVQCYTGYQLVLR